MKQYWSYTRLPKTKHTNASYQLNLSLQFNSLTEEFNTFPSPFGIHRAVTSRLDHELFKAINNVFTIY